MVFDYVCVLDFEATCEDGVKYFDHEVIEFPSVLLKFNGQTYEPIAEFQQFCKPLKNPTLSKFCTELTGITQEQVDAGYNFPDVLNSHYNWLTEQTNGGSVIILTCGYWDLSTMMPNECKTWAIIPPAIYNQYINVKKEVQNFYKNDNCRGMFSILQELGIELEGRHHSGIDDCRNIAKIFQRMVVDGYVVGESSIIKVDPELYKIKHPLRAKEKQLDEKRKQRLADFQSLC